MHTELSVYSGTALVAVSFSNHTSKNLGSLNVSDKLNPIPRVRYSFVRVRFEEKETAVIWVTASSLSLVEHSHSRVSDSVGG